MQDANGLGNSTDVKCDYCLTLHAQKFTPKRPLSPFIFFSQEVSPLIWESSFRAHATPKPTDLLYVIEIANWICLWYTATKDSEDHQLAVDYQASDEAHEAHVAQSEPWLDLALPTDVWYRPDSLWEA